MQKRVIKIKFQNGLDFESFQKEVHEFRVLSEIYEFKESSDPQFIIFGPYGKDIPQKGDYVRIGYFCENIKPEMSICEWGFGVPHENTVNNPNYKQIIWHGVNPDILQKPVDYDAAGVLRQKRSFCNFFYSHPIPYREEFFRQLSKYKRVDAPGKSMNNMQNIDNLYSGDKWERKRKFLNDYKFTIAFENYVYPGYHTEKLYDPMLAGSLPIYCGDPLIKLIFNTESFINAHDYLKVNNSLLVRALENYSQFDFMDILPRYFNSPYLRVKRKLKSIGKELKMEYQHKKLDFTSLIDQIIELDRDDEKYIEMLRQPWLRDNFKISDSSLIDHWKKIFESFKFPY